MNSRRLTHQFLDSDDVFALRLCGGLGPPEDVAICRTFDEPWGSGSHRADCVPPGAMASRHAPVDGELSFMIGVASAGAGFYFNTLFTRSTPYTTQERQLSPQEAAMDAHFNPAFHFALLYQPDKAQKLDQSGAGLPVPGGMSGALVWNTRRVEIEAAGQKWSPLDARVTGLVWGWHSSAAVLLATRVEHVLPVLGAPQLP